MKSFPLVLGNILKRKKLRNVLTISIVAIATLLICVLNGLLYGFDTVGQRADASRLVMRNKNSLTFPLPISYRDKVLSIPGVESVAASQWFGGVYKDPKNFFQRIAIQVPEIFDVFPELLLEPEEKSAFINERNSAIIGVTTAEKYNIKDGDTIELEGGYFPGTWDFVVRGIYKAKKDSAYDDSSMFFHWEYLNERLKTDLPPAVDQGNMFFIKLKDPSQAAIIQSKIDHLFENSIAQTRTETEAAFAASYVKLVGNIRALVLVTGLAVFFSMSMIAASTMIMSVRERTREIGTLRSIGFSKARIVSIVLQESVSIAFIGAIVGIIASKVLEHYLKSALVSVLPQFYIPIFAQIFGAGIAILIGIFSGLIPALRAVRLDPAKTLRFIN